MGSAVKLLSAFITQPKLYYVNAMGTSIANNSLSSSAVIKKLSTSLIPRASLLLKLVSPAFMVPLITTKKIPLPVNAFLYSSDLPASSLVKEKRASWFYP
jgi:hypothetical protein